RYMYRMVDNLLTTYKYEDIQVELHLEKTELNRFVADIVHGDLASLAHEKEHTLLLILPVPCEPVAIDPIEMRRVITNLIQNAITYTAQRGHISVSLTISNQNQAVQIAVKDNGIGIEPQKVSFLFQPYASMAKRFRHIGTGLGLYLSKQIVE